MPGNRHVVGRIAEYHLRSGVAEQLLKGLGLGRIAANQPMAADIPDIAQAANRRASGDLNNGVSGVIIVSRKRQLANQYIDFGQLKARHRNVKIDLELGQVLQLKTE